MSPIITDDLRLLSGYRDPRPDPLPCPLFLFQGEDDNVTVDNWAFYSTSRVDLTYFSGGYFGSSRKRVDEGSESACFEE